MTDQTNDRAGVVAPPPLVFLGFLGAGLGLAYFVPLPIHAAARIVGAVAIVVGLSGFIPARRTLQRAETTVNPYKPTTSIVSTGVYRFSRNPIYVSFSLVYLGIAGAVNTLWPILLFPLLLAFMHFGVILREERYLERKFGDEYRQYKARVRRWL